MHNNSKPPLRRYLGFWSAPLIISCLVLAVVWTQGQKTAQPSEKTTMPKGTAYYRHLMTREIATFQDGCWIISTLIRGKEELRSFKEIRASLMNKGIIPSDWMYTAQTPLTKGKIAYMLCKALGIKGGLTMRIFGVSERYALRECIWLGLISTGHKNKYVTGPELVAILGRASRYIEQN
jgi:hypothetical protein